MNISSINSNQASFGARRLPIPARCLVNYNSPLRNSVRYRAWLAESDIHLMHAMQEAGVHARRSGDTMARRLRTEFVRRLRGDI